VARLHDWIARLGEGRAGDVCERAC